MKNKDLAHSGTRYWHQEPLPFETNWGDVALSIVLGIVIATVLFLSL